MQHLIPTRLRAQLLDLLTGDIERVGFIVDGNLIEVDNIAPEPEKGFDVKGEDLILYQNAEGSWHTHPGAKSNLSVGDYDTFMNYPNMYHIIIGTDGLAIYVIEDGDLLISD